MSSPSHSSPLAISSSFSSKQALGKATARATRALPKSPQKKAQISSHLVSHLSPNTKAKVFCSARKKILLELGRPVISAEFKERVVHFLERPDISYCKPGRADTVYCGKNSMNDKIYKSKHYLLWTIQDMVELLNIENPLEKVSYYVVQQIIKNEKHLLKKGESNDDDCRCERWENVVLLLSGIKQSLKKMVCSPKTYDCCNDNCGCGQCCSFRNIEDILIALEGVSEVKYARWVCREKRYQKDEVVDSGDNVIVMLKQIPTKSFKMHVNNISRQYSELKYLKANLKEDEIILSVDFSKNYDNKCILWSGGIHFVHSCLILEIT